MVHNITYQDVYEKSIQNYTGETFLTYFENKEKISITKEIYEEKINQIASFLSIKLSDYPVGSYIALRNKNHAYWHAMFFAIEKLGFRALLLDGSCPEKLMEIYQNKTNFVAVISTTPVEVKNAQYISYEEAVTNEEITDYKTNWSEYMAFCTSGTTDTAKVILFHAKGTLATITNGAYYLTHTPEIAQAMAATSTKQPKALLTLPAKHVFGFTLPLALWIMGNTGVMAENESIFELIKTIKQEKIWFTYGVPIIWKSILQVCKGKYGEISKKNFAELLGADFRCGMIGGARYDNEFSMQIEKAEMVMINAYGTTETHGSVLLGLTKDDKSNGKKGEYTGIPENEHEAKLFYNNKTVISEGSGELLVKGPAVFSAFVEEGGLTFPIPEIYGYYRTGDYFLVENGVYYYQGRNSNIIVTDAGENIYPEELEEDFNFLDDTCRQFCITGYEDNPILCICPQKFNEFDGSELLQKIIERNKNLEVYKRIAKVYAFKDLLPITPKGEVARKHLAEEISGRDGGIKIFNLIGRKVK